jgi:surface carbohydrate biosynthesis protein
MTSISARRWLILPVETKARELHGKFLLALFAAERGWGTVIGSKSATKGKWGKLPLGVFIEKSIPPGRLGGIQAAQAAGNRVSAWCEEGLIYLSREEYTDRRINPESFDALDYFFAWGANQADDIVAELGRGREKIVVSGNPRFDLLRPEFRKMLEPAAAKLREQHGKIILINTFFRYINSGSAGAGDYVAELGARGALRDATQEANWRRMIDLQKKMFPRFLALLPVLSREFPDYTIVVRPHPSERNEPWLEGAKGLPNVKVIYEGTANEWIVASELSIHNNCTTGVEAFLLEKPTISYRPFKDDEVEFTLPNKVGFEVESDEALLTLVRRLLAREVEQPDNASEQLRFARHYIANIDGALACDTIMDKLETLDLAPAPARFPVEPKNLVYYLRKLKRLLVPDSAYNRKKFPGITLAEMEQLLKAFQEASGRFAGVAITRVADDGFCIYKP